MKKVLEKVRNSSKKDLKIDIDEIDRENSMACSVSDEVIL